MCVLLQMAVSTIHRGHCSPRRTVTSASCAGTRQSTVCSPRVHIRVCVTRAPSGYVQVTTRPVRCVVTALKASAVLVDCTTYRIVSFYATEFHNRSLAGLMTRQKLRLLFAYWLNLRVMNNMSSFMI